MVSANIKNDHSGAKEPFHKSTLRIFKISVENSTATKIVLRQPPTAEWQANRKRQSGNQLDATVK
jgi:hypothetical protein